MAETILSPESVSCKIAGVPPGSTNVNTGRKFNDWAGEHLEQFLSCAQTMAQLIGDLTALSDLTVELTTRELSSSRVSLMLTTGSQLLRIQAARGLPLEIVGNTVVKIGSGVAGLVASNGRPVLIEKIRQAPENLVGVGHYQSESYVSVPLRSEHQILGVVNVTERLVDEPFGRNDLERLVRIAQSMGLAIHRSMLYRRAEELAVRDELTGLYNRRYLMQFLERMLERARLEDFPVTFLLFDLDHFKSYNDRYGHPAGDEVLREVAKLMQWNFRSHDVVARLGGEEFAVILWDGRGRDSDWQGHPLQAYFFAERLRRAMMRHHFGAIGRAGVTLSGGLATFPWNALSRKELFERADEALYRAKRDGRNRVYLCGKNRSCQSQQ